MSYNTEKKKNNVSMAHETLKIIEDGYYYIGDELIDIRKDIASCLQWTHLYETDDVIVVPKGDRLPTIEVTNETTANAARRILAKNDDVLILNFASASRPGGGWLSGANAQEEDLVIASALYESLLSKPEFYLRNKCCSGYYSDYMILSHYVPFFRDDNTKELCKPFLASVITSPAPNVNALNKINYDEIDIVLQRRALKILQVAASNNYKSIVLGAWGCGIFGNDPNMVANAFLKGLNEVRNFDHVCFAVYDTRPDQILYETFKNIFIKGK